MSARTKRRFASIIAATAKKKLVLYCTLYYTVQKTLYNTPYYTGQRFTYIIAATAKNGAEEANVTEVLVTVY